MTHEQLRIKITENENKRAYKLKQFYATCERTMCNIESILENCKRTRELYSKVVNNER